MSSVLGKPVGRALGFGRGSSWRSSIDDNDDHDHYRWGAQYLTEGHGDRAGDSGGPVWTRYGLDELAIVGIWLGTHDDGDDTINGRFYPLPEALQNLGLAANPL